MHEGTITRLVLDRGFGFIAFPNEPDAFFHQKDLVDLEWTDQLTELRVRCDLISTSKGPRAKNVRARG